MKKDNQNFAEILKKLKSKEVMLTIDYDCPILKITKYDPKTGTGEFKLIDIWPLL